MKQEKKGQLRCRVDKKIRGEMKQESEMNERICKQIQTGGGVRLGEQKGTPERIHFNETEIVFLMLEEGGFLSILNVIYAHDSSFSLLSLILCLILHHAPLQEMDFIPLQLHATPGCGEALSGC